jgi:Fe-coproporphyrin III synthase
MSRQQKSQYHLGSETRGDSFKFEKNFWMRIKFYATYVWRFLVLQRPEPLIYGIALTDRCNLQCNGCHVSNTGRRDMTWKEVQTAMQDAWDRGFRELYFSGGEPMLWHDKNYTLTDAICQAKRIGFFHVHVYTNGLLGIERTADLVWVSMDVAYQVIKVLARRLAEVISGAKSQ